jgi:uncharacterized membrane protein
MAKKGGSVGSWAFIIGILVAVLIGLFGTVNQLWLTILVILGLLIGLLNITRGEVNNFLMAAVILVIVSAFGKNVLSAISILGGILDAIMALVVPATVIVALKAIYGLAKS